LISTDHDDHDGVHDDCPHQTQILACVFCLLHDAHTKHTLPVRELQPPQLAFQHGVCAREQDPPSPHASHTEIQQQNIQKNNGQILVIKYQDQYNLIWISSLINHTVKSTIQMEPKVTLPQS
jgi:hypothetical protein